LTEEIAKVKLEKAMKNKLMIESTALKQKTQEEISEEMKKLNERFALAM